MTFNAKFTGALLAATAFTFATPAAAQRVDRIVVFGDSYADQDNLFALISQPCPSVYPTCRFSGGTNYIDTLAQLLVVPVDNFAIGGALTTNNNAAAGPGVLGFPTEFSSFLAGGGPAAFPRVSGTFDSNDLLAISIGGNDARVYQQNGGTVAGAPAAAAGAVGAATAGLNLLVGAGARNISFLAGNTANLPEVAGNTAAQAVRNAFSTTFNTGIQATLAGYAANGVIVNYTDLTIIGNNIIANPQAYGLTSAGACNLGAGCVSNTAAANQFLFYVDNLHLTSAGFAIVARYIDAQMTAPLTLQAPTDLSLDVATQFGRTMTTRMDLGAPRDGDMPEGVAVYLVGDSISRTIDATDRHNQFKVTSVGLTGGVEAGFGSGMVGAAVNVSRPKANFVKDEARDEVKAISAGVYGGFGIAGGFVQGYAGLGRLRHDLTRVGVVSNLSASPKGKHMVAGIKAGYLAPMGSFRLGPVVALDQARARLNAYTEDGDAALTLNVNRETFSALRGSVGAELRGDFGGNGVQVRPYFSALVEKDFKGDGRTFEYAVTSAPTIVNRYAVEDSSKKPYGRLAAGLSAEILSGISINGAVSGTVRKKQGNETTGHLGLRAAF